MDHSRVIAILAAAVLTGLAAASSVAQTTALQERLEGATSLSCTFSIVATATWNGGTPAADVKPSVITVSFTNVSADDGTADAESKYGGSFVAVRYSTDYLHLMQMHGGGALYTTTVLAKPTKDGRLMAVHTRHEYTDVSVPGFTSRPEMYVGDCAIGN